jgi:hypothetical protein
MEELRKSEDTQEDQSPDLLDEEQSIDSTPTVVPESTTPVPSDAQSQLSQRPMITEQRPSFDDAESSWRDTMTPADDDTRSQRRSNRESTIYMPAGENSQHDDSQNKRRNRESMLMPSSKRQSWYESKQRTRTPSICRTTLSWKSYRVLRYTKPSPCQCPSLQSRLSFLGSLLQPIYRHRHHPDRHHQVTKESTGYHPIKGAARCLVAGLLVQRPIRRPSPSRRSTYRPEYLRESKHLQRRPTGIRLHQ